MIRVLLAMLFVLLTSSISLAEIQVKDWKISFDAMIEFYSYYSTNSGNYPLDNSTSTDTDLVFEAGDGTRMRLAAENGPYKFFFDFREDNEFEYIWGEWNFGAGTVLLGRNDSLSWNPFMLPPPTKSGIGQLIGQPILDQARITFPIGKTTLAVAALKPDNYYYETYKLEVGSGTKDVDAVLPTFEVKYDFPVGPFNLSLIGGMQKYTLIDSSNDKYDINSDLLALIVRYRYEKLGLHATVFWDKNNYTHFDPRQKGLLFMAPGSAAYFGGPAYDAAHDSIVDSETVEWAFSADYHVNDSLDLLFGCSGANTEDDYGNEDEAIGYSALAIIKLTDSVFAIPFVNYTDWGDRSPIDSGSIDEGTTTVYGVQWVYQWDIL